MAGAVALVAALAVVVTEQQAAGQDVVFQRDVQYYFGSGAMPDRPVTSAGFFTMCPEL